MNEVNENKDEEKNTGLTTAALAGVSGQPAARAVAVGSASSSGVATARAIDVQTAPLFSPEEYLRCRRVCQGDRWHHGNSAA
jgi:hypothetical protein